MLLFLYQLIPVVPNTIRVLLPEDSLVVPLSTLVLFPRTSENIPARPPSVSPRKACSTIQSTPALAERNNLLRLFAVYESVSIHHPLMLFKS